MLTFYKRDWNKIRYNSLWVSNKINLTCLNFVNHYNCPMTPKKYNFYKRIKIF